MPKKLDKLYQHQEWKTDQEFRNAYSSIGGVVAEVAGVSSSQGPKGPTGDQGPPGPDGNSNVQVFKTIVSTGGDAEIWTQPANSVIYNYFAILSSRFETGSTIEYFYLYRSEILSGSIIDVREATAQGVYDPSVDTTFGVDRTLSVLPTEQQLLGKQSWNDMVNQDAPVRFAATTAAAGAGSALTNGGAILVYLEYFILTDPL